MKQKCWEMLKQFIFEVLPLVFLTINYIGVKAMGLEEYKILLRVVAVVLCLFGCFLQNKRITFATVIFGIMGLLLLFHGGIAINLLGVVVLAMGVENNLSDYIKRLSKVNLAGVIVYVALMYIGVIDISAISTHGGRIRYFLGMGNPNLPAMFFTSSIILFILAREKLNWFLVVISELFMGVVYYYTDSRTAFFAGNIFLVCFCIEYVVRNDRLRFLFARCLSCSIIMIFVVHLLGFFWLKNLMWLDELLSYRIYLFSSLLGKANWEDILFGGISIQVDSSYYSMILCFGILVYLLFAFLCIVVVFNFANTRQYKYVYFLFSMLLYGVFEGFLVHPELLMGILVWKMILSVDLGCKLHIAKKNI